MAVKTKEQCKDVMTKARKGYSNPVLDQFRKRGSQKGMLERIDCGARYTRYSKIAPELDE